MRAPTNLQPQAAQQCRCRFGRRCTCSANMIGPTRQQFAVQLVKADTTHNKYTSRPSSLDLAAPAQRAPLAGAAAHVAGHRPRASALAAGVGINLCVRAAGGGATCRSCCRRRRAGEDQQLAAGGDERRRRRARLLLLLPRLALRRCQRRHGLAPRLPAGRLGLQKRERGGRGAVTTLAPLKAFTAHCKTSSQRSLEGRCSARRCRCIRTACWRARQAARELDVACNLLIGLTRQQGQPGGRQTAVLAP